MADKISKDMKITEILEKHPETIQIFAKHGFHCLGCAAAKFESLEEGASAHGVDVEELVKEMNEAVENAEKEEK